MSHDPETVNRAERELNQDRKRLRRRRVAKRLSVTTLAGMAGCSVSYLWQLENGDYSASPELLGRLADALDCDITDLMPPEPDTATKSPKAAKAVAAAAA
jgi:transcriptional regulator with XRE-family HTH domain